MLQPWLPFLRIMSLANILIKILCHYLTHFIFHHVDAKFSPLNASLMDWSLPYRMELIP